eukprot:scaffold126070_cov75-Phaeocystis_antarctica.AAC.5
MAIPTLGEPPPSPGMRSSMRRGSCLKSAARAVRASCGGVALNNSVPWAAASTFWLSAAMSAGTAAAVNRVGDRWMARLDKQRSQEETGRRARARCILSEVVRGKRGIQTRPKYTYLRTYLMGRLSHLCVCRVGS